MQNAQIVLPEKEDFKIWFKEAFEESLKDLKLLLSENPENKEELLTREEVATMLQISLPTLNEKTKTELASIKYGRKRMYYRSDVEAYLNKNRRVRK